LSECEDALAFNLDTLRFAVADGATEAFDSRRWARVLARAWCRQDTVDDDEYGIAQAARTLGDRVSEKWQGKELSWFVEEKARSGAFAAFLGLVVSQDGSWRATAIGDSCLFAEYEDELTRSFPLSSPEEFGSRPKLLPARHAQYDDFADSIRRIRGTWAPGVRITMMSDAVSCWYLGHAAPEAALRDYFHSLLTASDDAALRSLIAAERDAGRMRNDDVAILRLDWTALT